MAGPLKRGLSNILKKSPEDIVILSSLRTPITRSFRGGLKDAYPEELLSTVTIDPFSDPSSVDQLFNSP
jgi:acetyl-CoA acyltransferase 1